MRNIISHLDKTFESRVRLGIMSILMVSDWVDFSTFKQLLDCTDGNLASHLSGLEQKGYLEIKKEFVERKPRTSYKLTIKGLKAYKLHKVALEQLLGPVGSPFSK